MFEIEKKKISRKAFSILQTIFNSDVCNSYTDCNVTSKALAAKSGGMRACRDDETAMCGRFDTEGALLCGVGARVMGSVRVGWRGE